MLKTLKVNRVRSFDVLGVFRTLSAVMGLMIFVCLLGVQSAHAAPTPPTLTCASTASVFNTGFNGQAGPPLASGQDPVWETNSLLTGQATPPTGGVWSSAQVVTTRPQPPWVVSPFANAQWISNSSTGNQTARNDLWFRYTFNLDPAFVPADLSLNLSFYADNSVTAIYVNGTLQTVAGVPPAGDPYTNLGYAAGAQVSATLTSNWQAGSNTILVKVSSDPGQVGFLAQVTNNLLCKTRTLTTTKTASASPLIVGASGQSYAINIAVGGAATSAPITLSDTLPAGITTSGPITITGGTLSGCPGAGADNINSCVIAAGAAVGNIVVTVPVTVGAAAVSPATTNTATVRGGGDTRCPATGAVAANCVGAVTTVVAYPTNTVKPTLACTSTASVFNTGFNGQAGPPLASGPDPVWETNSLVTGQATPPTGGVWSPAVVVSVNKPGPWTASPFANAQWISNKIDAAQVVAGSNDVWFRYTFNLAAGIVPADLALSLSFYADNSVTAIYVNGVLQSVAGVPPAGNPYTYLGYAAGTQVSATLASNWQAGSNTILVKVSTDPGFAGFLASVTSNNFCRAALQITKSDNKTVATSGGVNDYVITLNNQGPGAANGVVLTDVVGAGLTCPSTNAVTCSVTSGTAVCPAGALTFANLIAGLSVANFPANSTLQFAYSCSVN